MAVFAVLPDGRSGFAVVRRSLPPSTPSTPFAPSPRSPVKLIRCRSARDLEGVLQRRLIEAIVLGTRTARRTDLDNLRARYPTIPVVILGEVRAEDAERLTAWDRAGVAVLLVEGVEDSVTGDLLLRHAASRRRHAALTDFPRLLRLTERLQLGAWEQMASAPGRPASPAVIAAQLRVSREHLSRQFGAGGAPNLKRVSDLLTVQRGMDLLMNPGYSIATVARLLGFASPSHLRTVVRRVAGVSLEEARVLTPRDLLRRFLRLSH